MQVAPIRVLVVEPDTVSRELICSIASDEPEMTIDCVDGPRLLSSIRQSAPDLVIVDAHTPSIKQVGSWEAFGIKSPPATIITAYDSAALTPFASSAVDLLLKPFDIERLEMALDLAKSRIRSAWANAGDDDVSHGPERPASSSQFLQRLAVETGENIVLVSVEDIQWMQSAGKYVRLHVGNRSHVLRQSMRSLQSMLDPKRFLRVHRNVIVNLDHVSEFHLPQDGNMFVKLNNGAALPLRKGNRSTIRKLLRNRP
jgi:two-component system LytT family response regulator